MKWHHKVGVGLILILLCPLLLILSFLIEQIRLFNQPGNETVIIISNEPPWEEMQPIYVQILYDMSSQYNPLLPLSLIFSEGKSNRAYRWCIKALVYAGDLEELAPFLEYGQIPTSGKNEALAGPHCPQDFFEFKGIKFHVVGKIKPHIAAFNWSYIIPAKDIVNLDHQFPNGWTLAWFDPHGKPQLLQMLSEGNNEPSFYKDMLWLGESSFVDRDLAILNILALIIGSIGGTLVLYNLIVYGLSSKLHNNLHGGQSFFLYRGIFLATHVAFYTIFFIAMISGEKVPLVREQLLEFTAEQFNTGGLQFIGDAYRSENIFHAALVTWLWNYGVATISMTILPSLFLPFSGVLKNALSFWLVGFVMAPTRTGSSFGMVYHSITMIVELEGYIIASFISICFVLYAVKAMRTRNWRYLAMGIRETVLGAVLAGIILAVAALYEAVTIITLGNIFG